jgi:hypothetical protein
VQINSGSDSRYDTHWLDVHDFVSWLQLRLANISYQSSSLIFKVSAFPVLHVSSALWVAVDNVLFQSALIVAAGKHFSQAF